MEMTNRIVAECGTILRNMRLLLDAQSQRRLKVPLPSEVSKGGKMALLVKCSLRRLRYLHLEVKRFFKSHQQDSTTPSYLYLVRNATNHIANY